MPPPAPPQQRRKGFVIPTQSKLETHKKQAAKEPCSAAQDRVSLKELLAEEEERERFAEEPPGRNSCF